MERYNVQACILPKIDGKVFNFGAKSTLKNVLLFIITKVPSLTAFYLGLLHVVDRDFTYRHPVLVILTVLQWVEIAMLCH